MRVTWWWAAAAVAGTAPGRGWNGLELGATDVSALEAWVAERGLTCETAPSPRRMTIHLRCPSPSAAAVGSTAPVPPEALLVVRRDDGPVHHVSVDHLLDTSIASAAYTAAVERWTKIYGPPTKTLAAPSRWDSPLVRASTDWTFPDLQVRVTVLRNGGQGPARLTERWDVPGVEAGVPERPGSVPAHGASSPSARNPHLED